jgi:hypothetical protein
VSTLILTLDPITDPQRVIFDAVHLLLLVQLLVARSLGHVGEVCKDRSHEFLSTTIGMFVTGTLLLFLVLVGARLGFTVVRGAVEFAYCARALIVIVVTVFVAALE